MDAPRFDALARALSASGVPRRTLAGLIGSVLGLLAAAAIAPDDAEARKQRKKHKNKNKRRKERRKKVKVAGPCGDGGGRANRCRKHRDCCTNYCQKRKGRKRGHVGGRCRCRELNQSCSANRNCCPEITGRTCVDGVCQSAPTCAAPGAACSSQAPCCDGVPCTDGVCAPCHVCAEGCPHSTIGEAITAAQDNATIRLCAGTYPETIDIAKPLTLLGAGAEQTILAGQATARVLRIFGEGEVTLQDLTVTGGDGGISNFGTLTLRGVAVTGNTTTSGGGGIFNDGTLTLVAGSRVAGNAGGHGGGIFNEGGPVILANSVVGGDTPADANMATGTGGGIYNNPNGSVTLQEGSRVSGNTADHGGGVRNVGGTVALQNGSQVSGNTATSSGGGISNASSGTVTVQTNAFVCDNTQTVGNQCAGTFIGDCPNPTNGICPA